MPSIISSVLVFSLFNDTSKTIYNLLYHRDKTNTTFSFWLLNDILHLRGPLRLMIHLNSHFFKINTMYRQAAKLRNMQFGIKENINCFIIFTEMLIIFYEFKKCTLLISLIASLITESFTITVDSSNQNDQIQSYIFTIAQILIINWDHLSL